MCLFLHPTLDSNGKRRKNLLHLLPTPERYETLFKKKKKKIKHEERKSSCRETAPGRGERCTASPRRLFMYHHPSCFLWAATNGLKSSNPFSISHFTIVMGKKNEAKRGWILISIVNNKLEKAKRNSTALHVMTSVVDSPLFLSLSKRPTWTIFFLFQHDSRLYKGISVHVCIYLFMCNLMGIVNMVRLLKLLFYLSGASCFSGFWIFG